MNSFFPFLYLLYNKIALGLLKFVFIIIIIT